jgi:hypothetical protein
LHISVYLMILHLAHIGIFDVSASYLYRYLKIPIYARCRNIKNTDICKMQKHQKYRYMQDAET